MRAYYCDHYEVPLPDGHPFPMTKYALLRAALVEQGILQRGDLVPAEPAPLSSILAVHDQAYVTAFLQGQLGVEAQRRIGFPWSRQHARRALVSVGGTLAATRHALRHGWSGNLAGGTHHAHADFGAGFCVFNDIVIAARWALEPAGVSRVLVVDLDVHQGDGTAALTRDDAQIFTLSLHGESNFPARKHPSDLDVPLADGTDDEAYLAALERSLERAIELARPELVLYQGGVDVLAADHLGRLALSEAGVLARDELALAQLSDAAAAVVLTLGGGYARPIEASVRAHLGTWRTARALETTGIHLRGAPGPIGSQQARHGGRRRLGYPEQHAEPQ